MAARGARQLTFVSSALSASLGRRVSRLFTPSVPGATETSTEASFGSLGEPAADFPEEQCEAG